MESARSAEVLQVYLLTNRLAALRHFLHFPFIMPLLVSNGYLLNCMHKQQDFFGCLAEILGCLGLREAANLEI